jgi:hypothetical protein
MPNFRSFDFDQWSKASESQQIRAKSAVLKAHANKVEDRTMSKKSTLAGIADEIQAEIASGALAPEPKSDVLASRGQSMRQFSDDLVYESYERIDPALCRPSAQNARQYGSLTYDDCADLIETIKSEGRQIMPAVVRHTGDPETPYEIVTGSRRHWACRTSNIWSISRRWMTRRRSGNPTWKTARARMSPISSVRQAMPMPSMSITRAMSA